MINLIFRNLLGYDLLILAVAAFNGFIIYPKAKKCSMALSESIQPKIFIPITLLVARVKGDSPQKIDLNAMKQLRANELTYYNIFDAIVHAFPMLGMLGTILSLLSMLSLTGDDVILNFTSALTSTFWGLTFALIFKAFDALLRTSVEQNEENLKLLFERLDEYVLSEDSHETH